MDRPEEFFEFENLLMEILHKQRPQTFDELVQAFEVRLVEQRYPTLQCEGAVRLLRRGELRLPPSVPFALPNEE
jgi:hypothetical protein